VGRRAAARAHPLSSATRATGRSLAALLGRHQRHADARDHTAIGHAHIDTAWLWPLEETYRKCVRTFASQLRLMDRLPGLTASRVRRRSSTRGSATVRRGSTRASRTPSRAASGCRSAGRGSSPTATCPPASRSCGSSSTASASSSASSGAAPRCSEPRRVRLQRQLPPLMRWRRHQWLPDPEAVLEPLHGARSPHVPLGRDRRLLRDRALPARRHLQRRGDRARAPPGGRATSRTMSGRRGPCWCSGGATAAAGRRRRCWRRWRGSRISRACRARRSATPTRSSASWRSRNGPRWSASSTSSTTAAPTRARRGPSARAAAPSGRCTTPSCWRRWRASRPGSRRLADAPAHHFHDIPAGVVDRRGARRGRSATWRRSRRRPQRCGTGWCRAVS